jgi:peptidoglycan/LPS O-acetylase OafA/YrhL
MADASAPHAEVHSETANNFDALRFWAALAVLWSHAVPLSYGTEQREWLFAWSGGQTTLGTVSVTIFFTISGYLITRSFERANSPWEFLVARALRILPALLVVLIAVAFVLGPIVSSLAPADYYRSADPYRYLVQQVTFVRFFDQLPGVFEHNPLPYVNGPLWTLRHEVECYALVFALGLFGVLNRYVTLALYLAGLVLLGIVDHNAVVDGLHLPETNNHLDLGTKFLAGALVYQWRLPLRAAPAALGFAVVLACLFGGGQLAMAQRTVLPYLTMFLALGMSWRVPSLIRFGDLSYGTYIYAWPVKQLVVLCSHQPHWFTTAAISTPIVLLLAWLSWHCVEKGALALKAQPFPLIADAPNRARNSNPE